jgi:hypothetical protein
LFRRCRRITLRDDKDTRLSDFNERLGKYIQDLNTRLQAEIRDACSRGYEEELKKAELSLKQGDYWGAMEHSIRAGIYNNILKT